MPGFSQPLNTDVNGKLTSSVYDTNISQWLQHIGNCLRTAGGLWVFQKGDAGGNAIMVGAATDNTAATGNPVQIGGKYSAADPALDDGDIGFIRVNSKGEPLVQVSGRTGGFSTPAHSVANVGITATQVASQNNSRLYLLMVNDSDTEIYIKLGAAAALNEGIRIKANGGSYEMSKEFGNLYTGSVSGIHGGTGTKNLLVTEGT